MNKKIMTKADQQINHKEKKQQENPRQTHQKLLLTMLLFALVMVLIPIAGVVVGSLLSSEGSSLSLSALSFWISIVISVIIALVLAYLFAAYLFSPVQKIQSWLASGQGASAPFSWGKKHQLGQFLQGILEQGKGATQGKDAEAGELADQTAAVSAQLMATTGETSEATAEFSSTVQELASGAEQQAKTITDINTTASQIFFSLTEIAESIKFVSESSRTAMNHSRNGNQVVEKITAQMDLISHQVNDSIKVVQELGERTNEIGGILALITDISNQTNLLALNAAIEAARAGEHGKGFSVVADEVRKLAEQTNEATGKIQSLIGEIQSETTQVIEVIKQGGQSVNEGIALNEEVGKVFKDIHSNVDEVDEFIQDVATAINDVTGNMDRVANSIENVAEITNQSTGSLQNIVAVIEQLNASMQEISASATMLSDIAHQLQAKVNK